MNKKKNLTLLLCSLFIFSCSSTFESKKNNSSDSFSSDNENNIYTITFKNYDESLLLTKQVKSGDKITYSGITPTKPNEISSDFSDIVFSFVGWSTYKNSANPIKSENLPNAKNDATYYAIFDSRENLNYKFIELNTNLVELDTRGTSDSPYPSFSEISYSSTLDIDNSFKVEWSLDNPSVDGNYFKLSNKTNMRVTISAIKPNRMTNLNLVISKDKSIYKTKIQLISYTNAFSIDNNIPTSIGTYTFEDTSKIVGIKINSTNTGFEKSASYTTLTANDDLIIPPKVLDNNIIKEVVSYAGQKDYMYYPRNCYLPKSVCIFKEYAFYKTPIDGYLYFEKSTRDFLIFYPKALADNRINYFLVEPDSNSTYSVSRFFLGSDYYSFPYTKYTLSENSTFESSDNTYNSWDWQTNYVDVYNETKTTPSINKDFINKYFYVTN